MALKEGYFLPVDVKAIGDSVGNVYKSIIIMSKRSNQLTSELKDELTQKLAEFAPAYDNLEEVIENKEQIEISRFYERKPKTTQVALEEFLENAIYYRDPHEEEV
jgi:DNA-directed RNA polymerase subunit K/omega